MNNPTIRLISSSRICQRFWCFPCNRTVWNFMYFSRYVCFCSFVQHTLCIKLPAWINRRVISLPQILQSLRANKFRSFIHSDVSWHFSLNGQRLMHPDDPKFIGGEFFELCSVRAAPWTKGIKPLCEIVTVVLSKLLISHSSDLILFLSAPAPSRFVRQRRCFPVPGASGTE